jgi:energy-coupling factor transporter ATP-binding protein EcfA2
VIRFHGVSYSYRDSNPALGEIDLALPPGEMVALLGRTGSGKTTLLRLSNGLALPGAGAVAVDGESTRTPPGRRRARTRVGLILGDVDNQLLVGSVEEEVAFGPVGLGLPGDEIARRVEGALAAAGLEAVRDRDPMSLPALQKYKTLVAALLAQGAEYLLVDGIAALPADEREELLALLDGLREGRGLGVLVAGPRRDDLGHFSRAIGLREGRVAFDGDPRQLLRQPSLAAAVGLQGEDARCDGEGAPRRDGQPLLTLRWRASPGRDAGEPPLALWPGQLLGLTCAEPELVATAEFVAGLSKRDLGLEVTLDGFGPGSTAPRAVTALARCDDDSQTLGNTVRADVGYGLPATASTQVEAALALVGLDHQRLPERHPSTLSGGQRALLAVAAALARRPRVLLLVEPFTRLDEVSAAELVCALQRWGREEGAGAIAFSTRGDELARLLTEVGSC